MALVKNVIKKQVEDLITKNTETDSDKAMEYFANGLTDIIISAIKSADIIIPAGIPVTTAGSPSAQTGATTAPSSKALVS